MAKFYGTLNDPDSSRGIATKCGYKSMRASAQTYDGSIITQVYYDDETPMVRIEISDGTNTRGEKYFDGTFDELKKVLKGEK